MEAAIAKVSYVVLNPALEWPSKHIMVASFYTLLSNHMWALEHAHDFTWKIPHERVDMNETTVLIHIPGMRALANNTLRNVNQHTQI